MLSEFKIYPVVNKIQNYKNQLTQHVLRMDRDRLLHLITKYQPYGARSQGRLLRRLL